MFRRNRLQVERLEREQERKVGGAAIYRCCTTPNQPMSCQLHPLVQELYPEMGKPDFKVPVTAAIAQQPAWLRAEAKRYAKVLEDTEEFEPSTYRVGCFVSARPLMYNTKQGDRQPAKDEWLSRFLQDYGTSLKAYSVVRIVGALAQCRVS